MCRVLGCYSSVKGGRGSEFRFRILGFYGLGCVGFTFGGGWGGLGGVGGGGGGGWPWIITKSARFGHVGGWGGWVP